MKKLDVNYYSFGHIAFTLLPHYLWNAEVEFWPFTVVNS